MLIEELIKNGHIHIFHATPEEIARSMEIARRDIALAGSIVTESLDWSYSIAYNAVLQASRAYMFFRGYRPATNEAHKNTFEFMMAANDEQMKDIVLYFDRVRKKRHQMVYNEVGLATEVEVKFLIEKAKEFIDHIEIAIKNNT
jgi:uncharacterized protein (UPF0332 family)